MITAEEAVALERLSQFPGDRAVVVQLVARLRNELARVGSIDPRLVLLESPFAGAVLENVRYARAAMRDSLKRGELPFASHLIYPQPGILDDNDPEERKLGIEAGLAWGALAARTVVYADLGISKGMELGIERAHACGRPVEVRHIRGEVAR